MGYFGGFDGVVMEIKRNILSHPWMEKRLHLLSPRQRRMVELRYNHNMTFSDVGREFDVSGQMASVIIGKAAVKLLEAFVCEDLVGI